MAIRGSLSEASLADVLQLLALGQKTGCLSIAREGSFGSVHFVSGRIVFAGLVNRRDQLGDRLVRSGALTPDVLVRVAGATAPQDDRELAASLIGQGAVDREVLLSHYRALVDEAVYHLFSWNTGTFTFEPETQAPDGEPLLSISADSLLLEGARRVDEWTLIEKKIPSLDLIFEQLRTFLEHVSQARRVEVPLARTFGIQRQLRRRPQGSRRFSRHRNELSRQKL